MKIAFFFLLLVASLPESSVMNQVRDDFHHIDTENELDAFIAMCDSISKDKAIPYQASAIMRKAEFVFMPGSKLKYFKAGRNMLEDYVNDHPSDVEARYVRLIVQSRVPQFLGYHSNFDDDLAFVQAVLPDVDLPESYKQLMKQSINEVIKTRE